MDSSTIPKAQPVEGEELQKILDENGLKSLEEYDEMLERGEELPGSLVIEGKDWRDVHRKLDRHARSELKKNR